MLTLPLQPAALIGRATELGDLTRLLIDQRLRLVTLTGPGGTGKTRLALAVAESIGEQLDDGACLVDLTSLPRGATAELVWGATARALGLPDEAARASFDIVRDALAEQRLLLVMDNVEHVLEATLDLSRLLEQCLGVQVLATSREPLRLRWEHTYAVPPLAPDTAAELFEERARAVDPRFSLDERLRPTVAELCERLDRLPLAIELAAARSRALSPQAILARLERRLGLLTSSVADLPERHQTLRATIAWSYDILDEADQRLFRALAVFVGSFSAQAAGGVLRDEPSVCDRLDDIERLTQLTERSLLRVEAESADEPRFSMLESLREFAREQLRAHDEEAQAARRHAAYYLGLVEQADSALQGPSEGIWLDRLEDEYDNLRAALRWALGDDREVALRLAGGLWRFWWVRGYLNEGSVWLAEALNDSTEVAPRVRAKALHAAGKLARERGDVDRAEALCRQSLTMFQELDDRASVALVLNSLGNVIGDRSQYSEATALYTESLNLRRELGDRSGAALALHNLAAVARAAGDVEHARKLCDESLMLYRESGDRWGIAIGLANMARLALLGGNWQEAQRLCGESLRMRQQLGDRQGVVRCLDVEAEIAIVAGRFERAARLLGAVSALRIETGIGLPLDERADHDRHMARVREALRPPELSTAWEQGRAMDAHVAIAYALTTAPEPPTAASADEIDKGPLSARELEVARLVAQGLSNRQIADVLIISKWTADNHVGNILRKLGLVGRAQIAAWLAERGLLEGVAAG